MNSISPLINHNPLQYSNTPFGTGIRGDKGLSPTLYPNKVATQVGIVVPTLIGYPLSSKRCSNAVSALWHFQGK